MYVCPRRNFRKFNLHLVWLHFCFWQSNTRISKTEFAGVKENANTLEKKIGGSFLINPIIREFMWEFSSYLKTDNAMSS